MRCVVCMCVGERIYILYIGVYNNALQSDLITNPSAQTIALITNYIHIHIYYIAYIYIYMGFRADVVDSGAGVQGR